MTRGRRPSDILTGSRILLSALLLFFRYGSPAFTAAYLLAGITDIADGPLARRTGTASAAGAKLDTAADLCFTAVAAGKILPSFRLPALIWALAAGIALIRLAGIVFFFLKRRELPAVHSVLNKISGLLLFLFPLTVPYVSAEKGAAVLCACCFASALQEAHILGKDLKNGKK